MGLLGNLSLPSWPVLAQLSIRSRAPYDYQLMVTHSQGSFLTSIKVGPGLFILSDLDRRINRF